MKKLQKLMILLALLPLMVLVSCKDEENPVPLNEDFNTLTTYMTENSMDLPDILNGWITSAPASEADVADFVSANYIIDIRGESDYNQGHIEGAVNANFSNLLSVAANSNSKPILIVCYTGQSAAHAVVALRLSGYPTTRTLKFGMAGWNSQFKGSWENNTGSTAVGHGSWTSPAGVMTPQQFDPPQWNSTATDGASMLQERVQLMLQNGFKGVNNADVLANPENYFVNNFWASTDTEHYGHIKGAYRIYPLSIADGSILNLDPEKEVVTYCWTGQTSSIVTAYLNVLGYNATSLKFGCNGMIYSALESHKYAPPSVDLPVVTE